MFIFYVSLTLYKLFGNCQAENGEASRIVAIFVPFPADARCVAGESGGCLFSPMWSAGYQRRVLFTVFLCIPHLGFSVAPGQRASGADGPRR